jgi:four helix bundle protein
MSKQGFKELLVWQRAKKLAVAVFKLTEDGKLSRQYALADQLRRSAVSVPSNIAEGDERDTDKESVRFFYIAKGSLAELITQLEISQEVGLLAADQVAPLSRECDELGRMLGALIKSRCAIKSPYRP